MADQHPSPNDDTSVARLRDRYLTLLRDALMHTVYRPIDAAPLEDHTAELYERTGFQQQVTGSAAPDELQLRLAGLDSPVYAQTMISLERMDSLRTCVERVLTDRVPGDLIEAGVWRGGASIFMRGILEAWGVHDRSVVVADSFEGLPSPDPERYPQDAHFGAEEVGRFAAGIDEVRRNFELYNLLDDSVEFVQGWFCDTLPQLRGREWALLRLDGDLYQSTMDCLENLYPNLSVGGYVVIDDYVLLPCRAAVHDFRERHGIRDEIVEIDWTGAYWRRS